MWAYTPPILASIARFDTNLLPLLSWNVKSRTKPSATLMPVCGLRIECYRFPTRLSPSSRVFFSTKSPALICTSQKLPQTSLSPRSCRSRHSLILDPPNSYSNEVSWTRFHKSRYSENELRWRAGMRVRGDGIVELSAEKAAGR